MRRSSHPREERRAASRDRRCRPRAHDARAPRPSDLLMAFFGLGVLCLLLAAAVGVLHATAGLPRGRWLALHLVFLGGISQLVLGAAQFFVGAFLATSPPRRSIVRAQLLAWNLGVVALAAGVLAAIDALVVAGSMLLLVGLALFAAGLRAMARSSLQRAPWASRWYYACAGFLSSGVAAGALLALGATEAIDLRSAHLALNVGGWFGTAIVGTLHTFFPSLTHTRLAYPRLQLSTFLAWSAGVASLAVGAALSAAPAIYAGWALLLAGALLLGANLARCLLSARDVAPAGYLVAVAQLHLPLALAVALAAGLWVGDTGAEAARPVVAVLLLLGWVGLTVLGSLVHLLSILGRVRPDRPLLASPGRRLEARAAGPAAAGGSRPCARPRDRGRLARGPGLRPAAAGVWAARRAGGRPGRAGPEGGSSTGLSVKRADASRVSRATTTARSSSPCGSGARSPRPPSRSGGRSSSSGTGESTDTSASRRPSSYRLPRARPPRPTSRPRLPGCRSSTYSSASG